MRIKDFFLALFMIANSVLINNVFQVAMVISVQRFGKYFRLSYDSTFLDIQLLTTNYTEFNRIMPEISEFEFQRLKEVGAFIITLQSEGKLRSHAPPSLLLDNSDECSENAYALNSHVGLGKLLRQNPKYSIDELKAITAHELGHILKGHSDLVPTLIRILHAASGFSIFTCLSVTAEMLELLTSPYVQHTEFEADKEGLNLYPNPHAHISYLEKIHHPEELTKSEELTGGWIMDQVIQKKFYLLDVIRNIYPVPQEQTSTHPPLERRLAFFKEHIPLEKEMIQEEKTSPLCANDCALTTT
jgi:hypothetical protein